MSLKDGPHDFGGCRRSCIDKLQSTTRQCLRGSVVRGILVGQSGRVGLPVSLVRRVLPQRAGNVVFVIPAHTTSARPTRSTGSPKNVALARNKTRSVACIKPRGAAAAFFAASPFCFRGLYMWLDRQCANIGRARGLATGSFDNV